MKLKFVIPLILFLSLVVFLAAGLGRDPHEVPSPLINKAAPTFDLPQLAEPTQSFKPEEMKGQVWMLNVWASWCSSCKQEHPVLLELSRTKQVPLIGLDYKDHRKDALRTLAREGDPYDLSAFDLDGRVGINYGVYGVPETYVIDKQGVIRYKHIGPITQEVMDKKISPLIQVLNQS
jgi:cytochrome c biogenesis protein CcmG/thiol:disulfide interchange protein DsbE